MLRNIKSRLVVGMALMIAPLVVVLAVIAVFSSGSVGDYKKVTDSALEVMIPLDRLNHSLVLAKYELYIKGGSLTSDRAEIDKHRSVINKQVTVLADSRLVSRKYAEFFHSISLQVEKAFSVFDGNYAEGHRNDDWERPETFAFRMDVASELSSEVHSYIAADLNERVGGLDRTRWTINVVALIALASALCLAVVVGRALGRSIYTPLTHLESVADQFSSDMNVRAELPSGDVFGRLATSFNGMANRLQKTVGELSEQAIKDELTGVANRREFERLCRDEMSRSNRYEMTFGLMLIDLDHFKQVNDSYGHLVGDRALQNAVTSIAGCLREVDKLARIGGEEFAVILPRTDFDGALLAAERIRHAVAGNPLRISDDPVELLQVTCSIGLTVYEGQTVEISELLASADQQMYMAKDNGRNRIYANGEVVRNLTSPSSAKESC